MSSKSRQQLEDWLKTIIVPEGSRVLDIGGSQLPIQKRVIDSGAKYTILDLENPHECKQSPEILLDLNHELFEAEIVDHYEYFDIAFCIEVTEYLWDPIAAMENIKMFLKPGGLLYISFHFTYPVHNPTEQDYLRYTPAGARKILEEGGFEILEESPRKFTTGMVPGAWSAEGMRPAKEYDRHYWQGSLIKARRL